MNDLNVLIFAIVGGLAGIIIVVLAFWVMRQEDAAKATNPSKGGDTPAAAPPPVATSNANSDWMSQLREVAPPPVEADETLPLAASAPTPLPTPLAEAPTLTGPFAEPAPAPATPSSQPANGWLGSIASRVTSNVSQAAPATQELLRLLRTPEGDLVVEVYGKRYHTRIGITDVAIEQQVKNASEELVRFLTDESGQSTKSEAPRALPALPTASKKETPNTRQVVKVSLQEAAQMEVKRPSMDIVTQFRYVRDQQRKPEVQIKTMLDEIDEILQVMIIGTPMAARGLKAADGAHGAVFSLDGRNYDSVDAIPDIEAQEMIRAAIQKWDQK